MSETGEVGTGTREFFGEVAREFLQHYTHGPRFVAVPGVPAADAGRKATG